VNTRIDREPPAKLHQRTSVNKSKRSFTFLLNFGLPYGLMPLF
jgi:hypothetical protein